MWTPSRRTPAVSSEAAASEADSSFARQHDRAQLMSKEATSSTEDQGPIILDEVWSRASDTDGSEPGPVARQVLGAVRQRPNQPLMLMKPRLDDGRLIEGVGRGH